MGESPLLAPDNENMEFPGYTKYEIKRKIFIFQEIYIPSINSKFYGKCNWEPKSKLPFLASVYAISSFLLFIILIKNQIQTLTKSAIWLMGILLFLFLTSFVKTIIDGPGYFPFYWSKGLSEQNEKDNNAENPGDKKKLLKKTREEEIEDEFSPSGIVSNEYQLEFVKNNPVPNRCIYSSSARRFVIRPDHYCDWVQCWIGKRNMKFFILFNAYGLLYSFFFTMIDFVALVEQSIYGISLLSTVYFLYLLASAYFAFITAGFLFAYIIKAFTNVTLWEEWNGVDSNRFNRGYIQNIEDVCGPKYQICLYPFPISPWKNKTNFELIQDYDDYGKLQSEAPSEDVPKP